jgi:hypothetical protein
LLGVLRRDILLSVATAHGPSYRKRHPAASKRDRAMVIPMIDFRRLLACPLIRLFRSRARLEAEILALRLQLNVLRGKAPKRVASAALTAWCLRAGIVWLLAFWML